MKISKKDKLRLDNIYMALCKGINFILEENTSIVRKYSNSDSVSIDKEIGSKICYLYQAQKELNQLILDQYKDLTKI